MLDALKKELVDSAAILALAVVVIVGFGTIRWQAISEGLSFSTGGSAVRAMERTQKLFATLWSLVVLDVGLLAYDLVLVSVSLRIANVTVWSISDADIVITAYQTFVMLLVFVTVASVVATFLAVFKLRAQS